MKNNNIKIITLLLLSLIFCAQITQAQQANTTIKQETNTIIQEGSSHIIPVGTILEVVTISPLSTSVNRSGDPVHVKLISSIGTDNLTSIPAGSILEGQIVFLQPSDVAGNKGQIKLIFNTIKMNNNEIIPIEAQVATEDGSGLLISHRAQSDTKTSTARNIIESGLGIAFGLKTTENEVEIPSGSRLKLVLNKKVIMPETNQTTSIQQPDTTTPIINTQQTNPELYSDVKTNTNSFLIALMEGQEQKLKAGQYLVNLNNNSIKMDNKSFNALQNGSLKIVKDVPTETVYKLHTLYDIFSTTKSFSTGGNLQLHYDQKAEEIRKYFDNPNYYPIFLVLENPSTFNQNSSSNTNVLDLNNDIPLAVMILQRTSTNSIQWVYLKEFPGFEGKGLTDKLLYLLMDRYILDPGVLKTLNQFIISKEVADNPYIKSVINDMNLFTPFHENVYVNLNPNTDNLKEIQNKVRSLIYQDVTKREHHQRQRYSY